MSRSEKEVHGTWPILTYRSIYLTRKILDREEPDDMGLRERESHIIRALTGRALAAMLTISATVFSEIWGFEEIILQHKRACLFYYYQWWKSSILKNAYFCTYLKWSLLPPPFFLPLLISMLPCTWKCIKWLKAFDLSVRMFWSLRRTDMTAIHNRLKRPTCAWAFGAMSPAWHLCGYAAALLAHCILPPAGS